jgi:hypothetical protein
MNLFAALFIFSFLSGERKNNHQPTRGKLLAASRGALPEIVRSD